MYSNLAYSGKNTGDIGLDDLKNACIMCVDDEPVNLKLLEKILDAGGYTNIVPVQDPREVLKKYNDTRPDIILLDLNMPHMNGYEVLAQLKAQNDPLMPPVVILTAQKGQEFLLKALENGARDYITKPFDVGELVARVRNMLDLRAAHFVTFRQKEILDIKVQERTEELLRTRLEIVHRLGRASEYRDNETGRHILRVSHTSALLAKKLGWSYRECETFLHAAPMHDIGKIGIPDSILLKPGKLEKQEWETMKKHTTIGADILDGGNSELLTLAREIALTHHEKWDGTGYPGGLSEDNIPASGRIVAIADVFDALLSNRPYKEKWDMESAVQYILSNSGKHFDPVLVRIFKSILPEIHEIREHFMDPD